MLPGGSPLANRQSSLMSTRVRGETVFVMLEYPVKAKAATNANRHSMGRLVSDDISNLRITRRKCEDRKDPRIFAVFAVFAVRASLGRHAAEVGRIIDASLARVASHLRVRT